MSTPTPSAPGPHGSSVPSSPLDSASFSLPAARRIVSDLLTPNPAIYWIDFLATVLVGHLAFALVQLGPRLAVNVVPPWAIAGLQAAAFVTACTLHYRSVMFIHELVHLPAKKFRMFRLVWNLLCGIPFLTPSFTYWTHLDHHRRRQYGTPEDGEYVALAQSNRWFQVLYALQGLIVPPLAVARFLLLTPLTWISPRLRQWVHQHASSLVIDPAYVRPLPTREALWTIRMQEALCFLWCAGVATGAALVGGWPYWGLLQGYATAAVVLSLNALRTVAAHRWQSTGAEMTFVEQMLDSVTIDNDGPLAVIVVPVGLRYHALHHLIPSLPYHNARRAHRRLMTRLPASSPYRETVEPTLLAALAKMWQPENRAPRQPAAVEPDRYKSAPTS